jgi:hypothetical protein
LSSAPAPLTTDSGGEGPFPFPRSNIEINDPVEANAPESTASLLPPALLAELIVLTLSALLLAILAVFVAVFVAAGLVGLALRLAASVAAMRLWFLLSIRTAAGVRPRCAA